MIETAHINAVIDLVEARGLSEQIVAELRQQFDAYHFTWCMDDDMDSATPAITQSCFNIYFIDTSNHCSRLTIDANQATGMVLAEVVED